MPEADSWLSDQAFQEAALDIWAECKWNEDVWEDFGTEFAVYVRVNLQSLLDAAQRVISRSEDLCRSDRTYVLGVSIAALRHELERINPDG